MKYKLIYMYTSNSQYFDGSHLPVVQVLVDENTTYLDIKLALLDTYQSVDHIENIDTEKYIEAVHELFANITNLECVPATLYYVGPMHDDEEWDLYMFFVLDTIEENS